MLDEFSLLDESNKIIEKCEDDVVSRFLESQEVKSIKHDRISFDYFHQTAEDASKCQDGWINSVNKDDLSVKYKFEEGERLVTMVCECKIK